MHLCASFIADTLLGEKKPKYQQAKAILGECETWSFSASANRCEVFWSLLIASIFLTGALGCFSNTKLYLGDTYSTIVAVVNTPSWVHAHMSTTTFVDWLLKGLYFLVCVGPSWPGTYWSRYWQIHMNDTQGLDSLAVFFSARQDLGNGNPLALADYHDHP